MWLQNQDHVIKNYKKTPTQHALHSYTSKAQKNKLIQAKRGTQACYVKIIGQPQL